MRTPITHPGSGQLRYMIREIVQLARAVEATRALGSIPGLTVNQPGGGFFISPTFESLPPHGRLEIPDPQLRAASLQTLGAAIGEYTGRAGRTCRDTARVGTLQ